MNMLELHELSFAYSQKQNPIIQHFSLAIKKGERVGVLGSSGSGKSTLLRLIAGLQTPTHGTITIGGRVVVDAGLFVPPEKRGVGMVFQDYALFPHMSVAENISFGLHRMSRAEAKLRLGEMVELVQLTGFEKRYPHELSGGQQQRVALARALAPKPAILLMDEPFSNLDAGLKVAIREELQQILQAAEITCLLVTHDEQDAEAICSRSVMMGNALGTRKRGETRLPL